MATATIKNTPSEFVYKVLNEDSATLSLADTIHDGVTPSGLVIKGAFWSTSGNHHIEIIRNSVDVLDLHNSGVVDFTDLSYTLDQEKDQTITIQPSNSGHHYSLILTLGKE